MLHFKEEVEREGRRRELGGLKKIDSVYPDVDGQEGNCS